MTSQQKAEASRKAMAGRFLDEMRRAQFDADLFGFDAEKTSELKGLMEKEKTALKKVVNAVQEDNRAAVASAVTAIKPIFAKIFMLFGNFPAGE